MDIPTSNNQYWQEKVSISPPGWISFLQTFCVFNIMLSVLVIAWTSSMGIPLGETLSIFLVIIPILFCLASAIPLTIWSMCHPPEERTFIVAEPHESGIISQYIEPTHTNGIPQELYKQGQFYATEKSTLSSRYAALDTILQADISNIGTSNTTIQNIYEHIGVFQTSIVRASDALIHILPGDMDILEDFENREVFYKYLDYLQHEMNQVQQISRDMTSTIQTWMIYNHIEVAQEKQKMEQLLAEGHDKISGYMSTLITATETLRARGDDQQVAEILVRQRI